MKFKSVHFTFNVFYQGPGTKDHVLIEILATRSNAEIKELVSCYKTRK